MPSRCALPRFGAVLAALAGLLLLPCLAPSARAAEIAWQAPAPCADADELRFRVERAIGMPLSHAAALRFVARARATERGYEASIDVLDATARRRTLSAATCPELVDMVTVTVALALGADGSLEPNESTPSSSPRVEPAANAAPPGLALAAAPAAPPSAQSSADEARGQARAAWSPGLALWLLADSGSLPGLGAGASLEARVEHRWLQLRASGSWYLEQHADVSGLSTPAPGADLGLLMGALSLCALPLASPHLVWQGVVCAGWELGEIHGEGTRVQRPRQGSALWSAPKLEAGASLALGDTPLRLAVQLTLALPLARENFVLGELGAVHRPPVLVGRAALGLEWAPR